ncbi:speriolin-like [Ranitomeya variabilis]|uniref:speriolin-like n=1 Tax=Ranitomeya variabilis TaxID=490064 RepID=UPI0040570797
MDAQMTMFYILGMKDMKKTEVLQHQYPEKVKTCQRIVGEIAFQLDRWILRAIFLKQRRLYGFRVTDIKEKILQVTTSPLTGKVDENLRSELFQR